MIIGTPRVVELSLFLQMPLPYHFLRFSVIFVCLNKVLDVISILCERLLDKIVPHFGDDHTRSALFLSLDVNDFLPSEPDALYLALVKDI